MSLSIVPVRACQNRRLAQNASFYCSVDSRNALYKTIYIETHVAMTYSGLFHAARAEEASYARLMKSAV